MQKLIGLIFLAVVTIFVFSGVRDQGFVWDDEQTIVENKLVNPATMTGTVNAWTSSHDGMYTPVPITIWNAVTRLTADSLPAKPSPGTLHNVNLLFHVLNVALVFLILSFFIKSSAAAFCGAMLFALHPMQVEPVAWITASRFVIGSFFGLVTIWCYLLHTKSRESRRNRSRSLFGLYIATLSFLLAMLSHPAMIVVPLLAHLCESLLPRKNTLTRNQGSIVAVAVWTGVGLPLAIWSVTMQDTTALVSQISFWERAIVAGDSLAFYLYKIFVPLGIGPDYGRSPHYVTGHWWGYLTWTIPLLLTMGLLFWQHKVRGMFAGAAGLFLIGIVPFLGLIAFENQAMSTVADRYMYLAMLGPALALAHMMSIPKKVILPFVGLVALVAFGLLSYGQVDHWKSEESLWKLSINSSGSSPIAHQVMGDRARKKGDWAEARKHYEHVLAANDMDADIQFYLAEIARKQDRHTSAIDLYRKVLELDPGYAKAYESYAMSLLTEKQYDRAKQYFEKAISLDPEAAIAHFELGKTLLALNNEPDALKEFALALKNESMLEGRAAEAHSLLGHGMHRSNKKDEARVHLEQALAIAGNEPKTHRVLADIYYEQGDMELARPHYEKAMAAYSSDAILYFNLGRIQVDAKENAKAAVNFEKAIELKPEEAKYVLNLAVAFFHLRRFGDAKTKFKESLKLDKKLPDAHYYLGDMERWSGKIDRALGHYYLALKIDSQHSNSHYRLGNYFMEKDKVRKAIWHYNSALKKSPEDKKILGRLQSAERKLKTM